MSNRAHPDQVWEGITLAAVLAIEQNLRLSEVWEAMKNPPRPLAQSHGEYNITLWPALTGLVIFENTINETHGYKLLCVPKPELCSTLYSKLDLYARLLAMTKAFEQGRQAIEDRLPPCSAEMLARARKEYEQEGTVRIDDDACVSKGTSGDWVQAWVYLDKEAKL